MGTGDTERLWAAVDKLTKPLHLPVVRDDGTETVGVVPCLWQLATEAIGTGNELGEQVTVSQAYRSPADLDLLAIRTAVLSFTRGHLARFSAERVKGNRSVYDLPEVAWMRHLASVAIAKEPLQLEWWQGQFEHFCRRIEFYLEPAGRGLRLRAPCPVCFAERVRQDTPTGPVMVHPIYVTMHENRVIYHAQCQACQRTWYRGDGLHLLRAEFEAYELRIAERTLVAVGS